jgi:hypothetical protein
MSMISNNKTEQSEAPEGLLYIFDRIESGVYLVVTACVMTSNL